MNSRSTTNRNGPLTLSPTPRKGRLTGLVVTGNPPRPMRNAKATGVYRTGHGDFTVTTDDEGRFSLTRSLHPLVVFASSDDGSLAGIADVTSDERRVTIAPIRWPRPPAGWSTHGPRSHCRIATFNTAHAFTWGTPANACQWRPRAADQPRPTTRGDSRSNTSSSAARSRSTC